MGILGELVYNNHDDQCIVYLGKPHDKIHIDISPNGGTDGQGLEGAKGLDQFTFVVLACITLRDNIDNILLHS